MTSNGVVVWDSAIELTGPLWEIWACEDEAESGMSAATSRSARVKFGVLRVVMVSPSCGRSREYTVARSNWFSGAEENGGLFVR